MTFPFYTEKPPKNSPKTPVELPPSRHQSTQTRPEAYLPDEGLVKAVNVALLLGQPLLLTGEPGTGKTQLAYSLAYQLGLGDVLKFETKSTSTHRDLFYIYDALGRFHAAQAAQLGDQNTPKHSVDYLTYNALGKAIILTNPPEKVKKYLPSNFPDYTEPRRSVVLIDEIDKAPRDFPNDILNEIENLYFRIPELGNVEIKAENIQPILILTSNSEKSLPEAFLRRCIYYNVPFPDKTRLTEIIEVRLETFRFNNSDFIKDALEKFCKLRNGGLRKKPSTAELLNWLMVLRDIYPNVDNPIAANPDSVLDTLSSLVKMKEDQETAERILKNSDHE